jgi:hypothetical protein
MKRPLIPVLALAAAAVFATAASGGDKKSATQIGDLAWMEGAWRHAEGEDSFDETWTGAAGGTMAAVSREISHGKIKMYELSTIEATPEGLVLRIRHFDEGLVPWKSEADGPGSWPLVSCADKEAAFENPAKDFPRKITYRREKDALVAKLEGQMKDKPVQMEFRLDRVSSK